MKKEFKTVLIVCIISFVLGVILGVILCVYSVFELSNKWLSVSEYTVESEELPKDFDGFRIAQVSDLHNTEIGYENKTLIEDIGQADPDIIVITGDIIDASRTDIQTALDFAKKCTEIAPVYFVSGNHEGSTDQYGELKSSLVEMGVTVLEGESVTITRNDSSITLIGIDDPVIDDSYEQTINGLLEEVDGYTVLLSHRPELFETYVESGADLVFSGHAHGGQIIIPGIGGLFAPGQGTLPEYYQGVHTENGTSMIVSRGIGNSAFPLRVNNRPELVIVELSCS